ISRSLTEQGIAVLRFDFTGLGESEGDFADTNFSSNVADLVDAAEFLAEAYQAPRLLVGHSLGGAAVLRAAAELPDVRAVVTIGAPANPGHVRHLLSEGEEEIVANGEATVLLAGRPFRIKKQFLDDLEEASMKSVVSDLRRPLLIFHSPIDQTVGIENAAELYQSAHHPKSFVSLDQADHLLSKPADSMYIGAVLGAWAHRYVVDPMPEGAFEAAEGHVVARLGRSGFRTEIRAGLHALVADEPASIGGTETGPTPYDYLLAGLGACTAMTLRMYADHKKIPLESVTVELRHGKIHAKDCADCETRVGKIDEINRVVTLTGNLSAEQRARLLEIADRCPVHRTLHAEIKVRTVEG
ncbi:MAG: bifunctional alpha/beta hydrolase/OsmC family protein, partial [Bacteroidota bacterium]